MFRWYFLFWLIGEAICLGLTPQYDSRLVSFSAWPENGIWDISKVRLIGRERLVNGTVTLREDMDNDHYSFSMETFSDTAGDGNFKLLPYQISRTPLCEAFKKYRPLFSKHAEYNRQTDFPIHRDTCPLLKGTYYLKNIQFSSENWPSNLPRGYIRANGSFYRDNEDVGTYSLTILITEKEYR